MLDVIKTNKTFLSKNSLMAAKYEVSTWDTHVGESVADIEFYISSSNGYFYLEDIDTLEKLNSFIEEAIKEYYKVEKAEDNAEENDVQEDRTEKGELQE